MSPRPLTVGDVEEFYAANAALVPLFLLTASSGLRATDGGAHSNRWRLGLALSLVVPAMWGLSTCLVALAARLEGVNVVTVLVGLCTLWLFGATTSVVWEQVMRGTRTQPPGA
jgi:hypothetical protein